MSAADLDRLASAADALAAPAADEPGADPAPGAPAAPGNYEAIGFLLAAVRVVGSKVLKLQSLDRTLGDREIEACASVLAPVADKYGLRLGDFVGGPEGTALMVAGPILWAAASDAMDELRARRAATPPPPASVEAPAATAAAAHDGA